MANTQTPNTGSATSSPSNALNLPAEILGLIDKTESAFAAVDLIEKTIKATELEIAEVEARASAIQTVNDNYASAREAALALGEKVPKAVSPATDEQALRSQRATLEVRIRGLQARKTDAWAELRAVKTALKSATWVFSTTRREPLIEEWRAAAHRLLECVHRTALLEQLIGTHTAYMSLHQTILVNPLDRGETLRGYALAKPFQVHELPGNGALYPKLKPLMETLAKLQAHVPDA